MCLSIQKAAFSGTRAVIHESCHPQGGQKIHVLGYQNVAQNLAHGPNAMVLHLPSATTMGEKNFVDTSGAPRYLRDIATSVLPVPVGSGERGGSPRNYGAMAKAAVFAYGKVYTVILADSPSQVTEALTRVPPNRRPDIGEEIAAFYEASYPGWTLAVCCFDNAEAKEAEPVTLWYETLFPELLVIPGIDAHDGRAPNLDEEVLVDHQVFFGHEALGRELCKVRYKEWPENIRAFLPAKVAGKRFSGTKMRNGDFVLQTSGENARPGTEKIGRFRPQDYPSLVAA